MTKSSIKKSEVQQITKLLQNNQDLLNYFNKINSEARRYRLVREECPVTILRTLYPDSEENYDTGYVECTKGWKKFYHEQLPGVLDELIDKEILERLS